MGNGEEDEYAKKKEKERKVKCFGYTMSSLSIRELFSSFSLKSNYLAKVIHFVNENRKLIAQQ